MPVPRPEVIKFLAGFGGKTGEFIRVRAVHNELVEIYNKQIVKYNDDNKQDKVQITQELQAKLMDYCSFTVAPDRRHDRLCRAAADLAAGNCRHV